MPPAGTRTDPGPLALLAALLASGDQRISATAFGDFGDNAVDALRRAGFLVPDGHLESAICDVCQEPHFVPVMPNAEGQYDAKCPVEGFLGLTIGGVTALSFSMEGAALLLGEALSGAFGSTRERSRPLVEGAWLLGSWPIGGAWTAVAITPLLDRVSTAARVRHALASLPRPEQGLVLVPGDDGFRPPSPFVCLPFQTAFDLDGDHIQAGIAALIAAATIGSAPLVATAGRPSVRDKVVTVLDGLLAKQHIRLEDPRVSGIVTRSWGVYFPDEAPPKPVTIRRHAAIWRLERRRTALNRSKPERC